MPPQAQCENTLSKLVARPSRRNKFTSSRMQSFVSRSRSATGLCLEFIYETNLHETFLRRGGVGAAEGEKFHGVNGGSDPRHIRYKPVSRARCRHSFIDGPQSSGWHTEAAL